MNRMIHKSAAVLAAFAAFGTFQLPAAEAKVVVMQAGSPSLAAGSSYGWAPTSSAMVDPASAAIANQITAKRLQTAIESAMASHGYRKTAGVVAADLAVSFHVVVNRQQGTRVQDDGVRLCGWRGCIRTWSGAPVVTEYNYTQGTLVIDLVDTRTGALVWRAASEKRVTEGDVSQSQLNSVVAKMMKSLPAA